MSPWATQSGYPISSQPYHKILHVSTFDSPVTCGVKTNSSSLGSLVNGVIWGTAEIAIGITSACLPCFRPFLTWAKNTVTSIASRNSSSAHTNSTGKKHSTDGDSTAYSHTFHSTNNHTYVGSPDSDKDSEKFDDIPLQGRVDGEAPLAQHAAHFHHPNPTASSAHQQQPQMSGGIGVRQDVYVTRGSPTDTGRMV